MRFQSCFTARRLTAIAGMFALSVLFGATAAVAADDAKRPNILMIAVDDLNDWIGCLGGHPQARTPNIDRLAARGTLFTNAHTQAPLCNPSRTSLFSGLRPSTTGVYTLSPAPRNSARLAEHVFLPQYLHEHGYHTYSVGKIYHHGPAPAGGDRAARRKAKAEAGAAGGVDRAAEFDAWGINGGGKKPDQPLFEMEDRHPAMDWGPFPERDEDHGDHMIATAAIEHLKSLSADQPFFVACGFHLPHVPCYAPQKWFDLYPDETLIMPPVLDGDRDDTPMFSWYLHWTLPEPRLSWLTKAQQWRPLVRAYLASISFMDAQVGRVLDALEATGRAQETIVVLWSDHGWHLGEKAISGKNTLWERSTHVPLIFAGPNVTADARCDQPAELLDIYPTLVELCGLPAREGLDGHSLVPQIDDATAERPWPAITTHNAHNHTARTRRWRYIRYADGSEELYDRQSDPNEWTNLAGKPEYAETIRELAAWLPTNDVPAIANSSGRLLTYENGVAVWEGKPIDPSQLEK